MMTHESPGRIVLETVVQLGLWSEDDGFDHQTWWISMKHVGKLERLRI